MQEFGPERVSPPQGLVVGPCAPADPPPTLEESAYDALSKFLAQRYD